jgi:integrase
MPGPKRKDRAVGPYPHGSGWRAVAIGADGSREYLSFASESEARDFIREFNARSENRTITDTIEEWLKWLRVHGNNERGLKEKSLETARYRLEGILRPELSAAVGDVLPAAARRLYTARVLEVKPDTHRGELALAQQWGAFCVTRGYLRVNPFEAVKPTGARNARKRHLRVDAARLFTAAALGEGSAEGLAAALLLLTGMRASEVCDRVVGDVDDNGRLLCIDHAKSLAGERQLEIPSVLRPRIAELVLGRPVLAPLFPGLTRHGLYHHVKRVCRAAGVPVVSPHDLRRSFASLSARSGTATEQVARTLGHADTGVTRRHYLDAGAEQSADSRRAEGILFGDRLTTDRETSLSDNPTRTPTDLYDDRFTN